jgi:uncharacterized membrane protein
MTLRDLRKTILTGAFLLLPVLALIYLLAQVYFVGVKLAGPVVEIVGFERAHGILLVNLAGLALVLGLCLLAGLASRLPVVTRRIARLERTLTLRVPGYALLAGTVRGAAGAEFAVDQLRTVLVRSAGGRRLGLEIECSGDQVVVFLPNAPNPMSGVAMLYPASDVEILDLSAHRMFEILQFHGTGMATLSHPPQGAAAPAVIPA